MPEPSAPDAESVKCFSLLYISDRLDVINAPVSSVRQKVALYVANAVTLCMSLRHFDVGYLTLLTNNAALVTAHLGEYPAENRPLVTEIPFSLAVPNGIPFYSAHFKIDAFAYLSREKIGYALMLDLDMIVLRRLPEGIAASIAQRLPLYYDISDQIYPEHDEGRVRADLGKLGANVCFGAWAGGELIAGTPAFFGLVYAKVAGMWPVYCLCHSELHHQGDEMLVSAALNELMSEGMLIVDGGARLLVGRYWSGVPFFWQRPYRWFRDRVSMLHLPQDKKWLASVAKKARFDPSSAQRSYGFHLLGRSIRNVVVRLSRLLIH